MSPSRKHGAARVGSEAQHVHESGQSRIGPIWRLPANQHGMFQCHLNSYVASWLLLSHPSPFPGNGGLVLKGQPWFDEDASLFSTPAVVPIQSLLGEVLRITLLLLVTEI